MALVIMISGAVVLLFGARFYSRFLARSIGEDPARTVPSIEKADGRDYIPTPTPVVFAHHFASIAGAGPILGPVIAIIYGWVPALLWVLFGGVLLGAVHDYLATYIAVREGGHSIATIAQRLLGKNAFVAITLLIIVMLGLVCATFLRLSATALTSMLPFDRLDLTGQQTIFRVVNQGGKDMVVIGGIASMSVIIITAVAPLLGWMYLKKKVAVWKCSLLAIVICGISITVGLYRPVAFPAVTKIMGVSLTGQHIWMLILSGYVLVAAGLPVWIFLQSRDFINVHILYVGMGLLLITLITAGARGAGAAQPIPAFNIAEGTKAMGPFWPTMFIVIACGAISGFHSLCASGTTCKQVNSELAARRVGYYGMLLESFLSTCVIAALFVGASKIGYLHDVHPSMIGAAGKSNPVLGFAMAIGSSVKAAFSIPTYVGAVGGMILLEGFLVTTLDTAIRLTRYLIEEIWRVFFGKYDVFASPETKVAMSKREAEAEFTPIGAEGLPAAPMEQAFSTTASKPIATRGIGRAVLKLMRQYWFNSSLAVAMTLAFAFSGGARALWKIFGASNQLLAAMVLTLATMWLLKKGKSIWFAVIPAIIMLTTTITALVLMGRKFIKPARGNLTLFTADVVIMLITIYLLVSCISETIRWIKLRGQHKS